jgi:hypothetical protein
LRLAEFGISTFELVPSKEYAPPVPSKPGVTKAMFDDAPLFSFPELSSAVVPDVSSMCQTPTADAA